MDRPNDNLIARLEQSLRESRAARMHLSARLRELEAEADTIRTELAEMDHLASQTQAAIYRLLASVLAANNLSPGFSGLPSDAELEAAMRQSAPQPRVQTRVEVSYQPNAPVEARHQPSASVEVRHHHPSPSVDVRRQPIPIVRSNVEAISDRFMDRTIPQAVTMLLREEGAPLHVNEIYNRLLEGGFKFTGANPTISIAVSLNRNGRFRKMAPGTFDLMMRDASKAS
jgi:hypothetical protein